jgi:hypothetical protein
MAVAVSRWGSKPRHTDRQVVGRNGDFDLDFEERGGLVPLRFEEGRPKAVRDKVAGKGQQQYY